MTLSYIPSDTNDEGILKATASGILPSGQPVIVNADGTVSVVAVTSVSQSVGTPAVFESAAINGLRSAYDSNSNRVVITYMDLGNSNYGTCVVGTLNPANNSVSFGTPVVFESHTVSYDNSVVFDSNSNKVVVFYNTNASGSGQAKVGTVDPSDNSITFGSSTQFDNNAPTFIASTFDSNVNKVVVAFRDAGQSNAAVARVGTISGTSISFGTQATVSAGSNTGGDNIGCAFDSTSNRIVFAYRHVGNSNRGTAVVGNISGTNLAFGTPVVFNSGVSTIYCSVAYDSIANKSVIVYADQANSNYGTAIVATVTALNLSISFGSAVVFTSNFAIFTNDNGIAYDTSAGKVVIGYRNVGNSNYGTAISGTVSGTSISFDSPLVFKTALINNVSTVYDSTSERILIGYKDDTNSNYGTGIVYRTGSSSANLTAENYIGMSSGVVDATPTVIGTAATFEAGDTRILRSTFDSNSNRVVLSYRDVGNSSYGTAVVGSINSANNTISFGTPVVFNAATTGDNIDLTFDSNSNKVVIAYRDEGNSDYGMAIVGTVDPSDNSISFGSEAAFESAATSYIGVTFDNNSNKVVIAYQDAANSLYGTAIVGTVSGTSISFGSATIFESARSQNIAATFDSNLNKVVIAFKDYVNSEYGTAIVGTVSGTSISFGSAVVFEAAAVNYVDATYDAGAQKIVIVYRDDGNTYQMTSIVGTVSGTGISFGSGVVFDPLTTAGTGAYPGITYDTTLNKVLVSYYRDTTGQVVTGTVSGTSISFAAPVEFTSTSSVTSIVYDTNAAKAVISYKDTGDSNKGKGLVYQPFNAIRGQVPSGSQAITNIIGSVSSTQIGLTAGQAYYVQTDGTIGTTAGSPSVFAGTAISATKLIVKT